VVDLKSSQAEETKCASINDYAPTASTQSSAIEDKEENVNQSNNIDSGNIEERSNEDTVMDTVMVKIQNDAENYTVSSKSCDIGKQQLLPKYFSRTNSSAFKELEPKQSKTTILKLGGCFKSKLKQFCTSFRKSDIFRPVVNANDFKASDAQEEQSTVPNGVSNTSSSSKHFKTLSSDKPSCNGHLDSDNDYEARSDTPNGIVTDESHDTLKKVPCDTLDKVSRNTLVAEDVVLVPNRLAADNNLELVPNNQKVLIHTTNGSCNNLFGSTNDVNDLVLNNNPTDGIHNDILCKNELDIFMKDKIRHELFGIKPVIINEYNEEKTYSNGRSPSRKKRRLDCHIQSPYGGEQRRRSGRNALTSRIDQESTASDINVPKETIRRKQPGFWKIEDYCNDERDWTETNVANHRENDSSSTTSTVVSRSTRSRDLESCSSSSVMDKDTTPRKQRSSRSNKSFNSEQADACLASPPTLTGATLQTLPRQSVTITNELDASRNQALRYPIRRSTTNAR